MKTANYGRQNLKAALNEILDIEENNTDQSFTTLRLFTF